MSDDLRKDIGAALRGVGKEWREAKATSGSRQRVSSYRLSDMRVRKYRMSIRDAAFKVIPEAYRRASSNGRYHANARQIFYAARPKILEMTGRQSLSSQYFTQTLLKDYQEEVGGLDRLVYDARGHLQEPFTGSVIGLGGAGVLSYRQSFTNGQVPDNFEQWIPEVRIDTHGPSLRFDGVLFIEKEGFDEILLESDLLKRYDLALASTKGVPVSALCDLLGALACEVYVLHDFDKSGFVICGTLKRGARGSRGGVDFHDLGLRMKDINGLPSEPVQCTRSDASNLRDNGATEAEVEFLTAGQRVELNAMDSETFLAFVERKLKEAGAAKVLPDQDVLEAAYRRAAMRASVAAMLSALKEEEALPVPEGLAVLVKAELQAHPERSWDEAISDIYEGIDQ